MRTWLVNRALDSVESRMNCADNNHVTGLWNSFLTLRGIEWIHVWWQLMDLECFSIFGQVPAFSSLVGGLRYVLTRDQMTIFCFSVNSSVLLPYVFLVIPWLIHVHSWTSAHLKP